MEHAALTIALSIIGSIVWLAVLFVAYRLLWGVLRKDIFGEEPPQYE